MDELHRWLKAQLDERLVEPNGSLGGAISYMLKHWEKLTLFLRVPGAPLDNNVCERTLKMSIRHRRNSLFYKTQRGADVGDLYMSLVHTCYASRTPPVNYLTQLQRNHERVRAAPGDWMPWNYQAQLVAAESGPDRGRGPPCDGALSCATFSVRLTADNPASVQPGQRATRPACNPASVQPGQRATRPACNPASVQKAVSSLTGGVMEKVWLALTP